MKIVVFDNVPVGGAKRCVVEQLKGLKALKHDVYWFTNNLKIDLDSTLNEDHIFYVDNLTNKKQLKSLSLEAWILFDLTKTYSKIKAEILKLKPDIVLVHPDMHTQAPFLLADLSELPTVYYAQEWYRYVYEKASERSVSIKEMIFSFWHRSFLKKIDDINIKAATAVLTSSKFNQLNIKKAYGLEAKQISLGVDAKSFSIDVEDRKRDRFLFFGSPDVIHGYPILEEAKRLANWPFEIEEIDFKDNNFKYSQQELVAKYNRAVGVICLDRNEPFGLIPLEAMACGSVPIAIKEGGYLETIKDGETGCLIEPDGKSLLLALKKVAKEKEWREQIVKNGLSKIKDFSWKKHVQLLAKELHETVDNYRRL